MKRVLLTGMSGTGKSMTGRLAARTGNPYGKADGDMGRILADLAAVEPLLRKAADHEIRTTIPLADVVAKVLSLTGCPQTVTMHAGRTPAEHPTRPEGISEPRE